MIKKTIYSFLIFSVVLFALPIFAAPISLNRNQVLATIRVDKNTQTITRSDLDDKIAQYKSQGRTGTDAQILDTMINDKIFLMNAEKDGINVTDEQIDQKFQEAKTALETQAGQTVTDAQLETLILAQYGMGVPELKQSLKEQQILQDYLRLKKPLDISKTFTATDTEIQSFYNRRSSEFVQPKAMRISHIVKNESNLASENQKNSKLLQEVLADVMARKITFEEAVEKYSDVDASNSKGRGGDTGWVTYSYTGTLGEEFIDTVMGLKTGEIAQTVLHSPLGYHIVKVTATAPRKFLELDDTTSPDSTQTVKEYIRNYIVNQKSQENYITVTNSLVTELRSAARVTINDPALELKD